MNKKMLIIGLAVVLLGGGGAGAFFMFGKSSKPQGTEEIAPLGPPGLVPMETFLVNINDPSGERYAKLTLQLTVAPASVANRVTGDVLLQARMRDRVLTLLTSKSYEELSGPLGKEGFRREVKMLLDPLIEKGEIQDVLFQDFVVQ